MERMLRALAAGGPNLNNKSIYAVFRRALPVFRPATDQVVSGRRSNFGSVLRAGRVHRLLREGQGQYERGLLPGGPRDDGLDCGAPLRLGEPGIVGVDG